MYGCLPRRPPYSFCVRNVSRVPGKALLKARAPAAHCSTSPKALKRIHNTLSPSFGRTMLMALTPLRSFAICRRPAPPRG